MDKPTLDIGTGIRNKETKEFFKNLIIRQLINQFGRMIDGAALRINGNEEDVSDMTVDEAKAMLDKYNFKYD